MRWPADPRVPYVLATWAVFAVVVIGFMALRRRLSSRGEQPCTPSPRGRFWVALGVYLAFNVGFFVLAWAHHHYLAWAAVALGLVAMTEVARASIWCSQGRGLVANPLWYGLGTAFLVGWFAFYRGPLLYHGFVLAMVVHVMGATFAAPPDLLFNRTSLAACALVYLPVSLLCLLHLKVLDDSGFLLLFYYLIVCASDTFGQIVGRLAGRRPLSPTLSPNKTIEGALGSVAGGVVVGLAFRCCLPDTPLAWTVAAAVFISICAILGDLVVSAWKRAIGIKDFSTALGAHGGVVDRLDSMLLAASAFYLFTAILPR